MKRASLSFIIPCHCVERPLLESCLRSVVACAKSIGDYEVIVVDDGSPAAYGTQALVEGFPSGRIRYVSQTHAGPSAARNAGLALARMEYVQFVDADDYLFPSAAPQLYSLLEEERPDVLAFGRRKVYGEEAETAGDAAVVTYDGSGTDYMLRHNLKASVWGYVFRFGLADGLRFREGIVRGEDELFTPLLFVDAPRLMVVSATFYAYRQLPGSIIRTTSAAKLSRNFDDGITAARQLTASAEARQGDSRTALLRRARQLSADLIHNLICTSPDSRFLLSHVERLRHARLYPARQIAPDLRHRLFQALTCSVPLITLCWLLYTPVRRLKWRQRGLFSRRKAGAGTFAAEA